MLDTKNVYKPFVSLRVAARVLDGRGSCVRFILYMCGRRYDESSRSMIWNLDTAEVGLASCVRTRQLVVGVDERLVSHAQNLKPLYRRRRKIKRGGRGPRLDALPEGCTLITNWLKRHDGCFVYFLVRRRRVKYCGSTESLNSRIMMHVAEKPMFDKVYVLPVPQLQRFQVERQWQFAMNCPWNRERFYVDECGVGLSRSKEGNR